MRHVFLNGVGASAGAGLTYLYNVIPRLSSEFRVQTTVALQPQLRREFNRFPNVKVLDADVPAGIVRRFWFEQRKLPRLIRARAGFQPAPNGFPRSIRHLRTGHPPHDRIVRLGGAHAQLRAEAGQGVVRDAAAEHDLARSVGVEPVPSQLPAAVFGLDRQLCVGGDPVDVRRKPQRHIFVVHDNHLASNL